MLDNFSMPGGAMMDSGPPANPFPIDLWTFFTNKLSVNVEPGHISQADTAYPAITYQLITSDTVPCLEGDSGIKYDHYQFDSWSPNYFEAATAADSLFYALNGYKGLMGSTEVLTVTFQDSFSRWEKPVDADDVGVHRFMNEFLIAYRVDTPNNDVLS